MKLRTPLALCLLSVAALPIGSMPLPAQQPAPNDRNVILVMTDGLRWQELFRGAEESLLTSKNYWPERSLDPLKQRFLAPTPEARRARLLPFLWGTLIPQGTIYGDLDAGSDAHVTNGFNFSYPGYSETLTGHPDPRIDSNDNKPNPNVTVLEWLDQQPGLRGRVAAFGAWELIAGVVNAQRCGFPVNVSYDPLLLDPSTPGIDLLNHWKSESPRIWEDEAFDAPTFYTALEYLKLRKPRVLFLSLGETDDWAHAGNYGEYLASAQRVDSDLSTLWNTLQSLPEYRGKTTLIFLTDHGRGNGPESWKSHGQKLPESKNIFIGLFGAGVSAAGVQKGGPAVTQNQVAATLAQYLGLDWKAQEGRAGDPLPH